MEVQLDYFRIDTGEWLARGSYKTQLDPIGVIAEVKWLMQRKELPNAIGLEAAVLITLGNHPHRFLYPHTVKP